MNLALATKKELETVILDDMGTLEDAYYAKCELASRRYNPLLGDVDTVIANNMGLVYMVVNRMFKPSYGESERDDFIQEGIIGMLTAYERYDGSTMFSTYAAVWIKSKIRRYIQEKLNTIRIPVNVCELAASIKMRELENESAEEIKKLMKCSLARARKALEHIHKDANLSIEKQVGDNNAEYGVFIGHSADFTGVFVKEFLSTLNDRQRTVLTMRVKGYNFREISEQKGLSRQRWHIIMNDVAEEAKKYFGIKGEEMQSV